MKDIFVDNAKDITIYFNSRNGREECEIVGNPEICIKLITDHDTEVRKAERERVFEEIREELEGKECWLSHINKWYNPVSKKWENKSTRHKKKSNKEAHDGE